MDDETRDRLKALEARVRRLEALSAALVELHGKADVEARLRRTELVDLDDDAEPKDGSEGAVRGSVYRGASATAAMGTLVCSVCRRPLDADDPEITLDVGRVCLMCSQRERR